MSPHDSLYGFDDHFRPPDVKLSFQEYSEGFTYSCVRLHWAKAPYLSTVYPEDYLLEQRQEMYDWIKAGFPLAIVETPLRPQDYNQGWRILLKDDKNNSMPVAFKLQWGERYSWPK